MSKTKQILEIARKELDAAEGDSLPKADVINTLDTLIKTMPQAQAMDEQQLDIMVTYLNFISAKTDLLFSATALCGLGLANDLKVRATIKDMERKYEHLATNFQIELNKILDPDYEKEVEANRDKVAEELKKDDKK